MRGILLAMALLAACGDSSGGDDTSTDARPDATSDADRPDATMDATIPDASLDADTGTLTDSTTPSDGAPPDASLGPDAIVEIAAGGHHACARTGDGRVFCWGANNARQTSNVPGDHLTPIAVADLTSVSSLALGYEFSGVLDATGLLMWGANNTGQLGDGTTTTRWFPTPVDAFAIVAIPNLTFGHWHACSIIAGGAVVCSGLNDRGQRGDGTVDPMPIDRPDLGLVEGLTGVTQISNGYFHNCARKSDGTAVCWGLNAAGQCGTGARSDAESLPTAVVGLVGVRQVAAGSVHSCAVLDDGTVSCWGGSGSGQLGSGSTSTSLTPVTVSGPTGAVQIATSSGHVCAVTSDGALWCWGRNMDGQVGNGETTNQLSAVRIGDGYLEVAAGEQHTCARRDDGTVRCWGNNDRGQLGVGSTLPHPTPMPVGGLP